MAKQIDGLFTVNLQKDEILCLEGDSDYDLYMIHSGKLLVCVTKGSQVTPISYLGEGEYLGELSFFDRKTRSAHVICVEDASLIRIPIDQIDRQFPQWMVTLAKSLTKKIRIADQILKQKGIRRKNLESLQPLSIEEQTHFFQLIKTYETAQDAEPRKAEEAPEEEYEEVDGEEYEDDDEYEYVDDDEDEGEGEGFAKRLLSKIPFIGKKKKAAQDDEDDDLVDLDDFDPDEEEYEDDEDAEYVEEESDDEPQEFQEMERPK